MGVSIGIKLAVAVFPPFSTIKEIMIKHFQRYKFLTPPPPTLPPIYQLPPLLLT